ncbi:MAG: hypothetical protein LBE09_05395, partial [Christensenellaceae bacterium]|nr:hypothetical protein [Christensenellaceae bacterium]
MYNNDLKVLLDNDYRRSDYLYLIDEILFEDFDPDIYSVGVENSHIFANVHELGRSKQCGLKVYEAVLKENAQNKRVGTVQEMFRIMHSILCQNAIVAFVNADRRNYRISLLTSKYVLDEDYNIITIKSNPRRHSYFLGLNTKSKTAYDFLLAKGKVNSLEELQARFSVEAVSKLFYDEIALLFTQLIGGERFTKKYERLLKIYKDNDKNKYAEFGVRLIGRLVFCWFLKEKKSANGIALIPEELLTVETIKNYPSYYHSVLEPLFFEILNTPQLSRKEQFINDERFMLI